MESPAKVDGASKMDGSGPNWTVSQSVKENGHKSADTTKSALFKGMWKWTVLKYQSVKLDSPEAWKWTLQKYESGRFMNI